MTANRAQLRDPLSMASIADAIGGELCGDGKHCIERLVTPEQVAGPMDLLVAITDDAHRHLEKTHARAAVMVRGTPISPGELDAWVLVGHPRLALARLVRLFQAPPPVAAGIHPSAVVESRVEIAEDASIGPLCYVAEGAVIGPGVRLLSQVTVGSRSRIGAGSVLHPGVRIGEDCELGQRVIVYGNACIGAEGFSFTSLEQDGLERVKEQKQVTVSMGEPVRIASLGRVLIEDNVEVGACSTIDRATLGDTVIGRGSKLDNLTMVGHNVRIGRHCLIAGQSGIAGSCTIGDRVMMGGQVGIADHMRVGSDVAIAASSGVSQHIPRQSVYIDTPAVPYKRWRERYRSLGRLKRMFAELERLKQRLTRLESRSVAAPRADERDPHDEV